MLRFAFFGASLCTLVVFFAISAEVAGGRYTKRSGGGPFSVCPDSRALSVSARKRIICIRTVLDDTNRDALDNIAFFQ